MVVDPVMSDGELERLIGVLEAFPLYTPSTTGSYGKRQRRRAARAAGVVDDTPPPPPLPGAIRGGGFAPGLGQRVDANQNYRRQGGLRNDHHDPLLGARSRYFRETLLDGPENYAPGVEEFLGNGALADAARRLTGRNLVEPWNVYANIMLPGQELGVHTDIPEFRGAHRDQLPGWLLCAMHLSGLFEPWRVRITTGVTYVLGDELGGAFLCFPDGPEGPAARYPCTDNTALVLDTDSVFHGVEKVSGEDSPALGQIDRHTRLVPDGHGRWSLRCGPQGKLREVASYQRDELRVSVSWKAYCYADRAERDHRDSPEGALTLPVVIDMLVEELMARGRLTRKDHGLSDEELGMLIIDEFTRFPDMSTVA